MDIERGMPPMEQPQPKKTTALKQSDSEELIDSVSKIEEESVKKRDDIEIAKIRASLGLEQIGKEMGLSEKNNEKPTIKTIDDLKKIAEKEGGMILYHGGFPDDTEIDKINLDRLGTQQNKKGKTYGGFYLTDESSKSWTEKYAQERNGNIHGFLIDSSSRILEIKDKDIDRFSQEQRNEFARKYDLIKGKDLLGRVQYILLNKDVVKELGIEKINPKK